MKRGILLATVPILITGAASAHLLTAAPPSTSKLSTPDKSTPVEVGLSDPLPKSVSRSSLAPVLRRASVDIRQAPVPMQVKPRTPVALPSEDTSEAYTKGEVGLSAGFATGDKSNEDTARAAIEVDGYKNVQILRKDNGVWHAKALRGKATVFLAVDSMGTVTTAD